ncbi:uncharacterized protein MONBRDRAFT_27343 [Monosiga brevicollis MX1]|uniref:Galactosylgalactosylxylosylprotein 3-beta-glucuronosyltransferase n=1 Tax=Monosiga brevicollis TaxID=81824 RepID=A9V505_MONBE|nr:uncharacterized protein MONBRDRAFT_27343 [Monosiga brevicollis MX1]EDQ87545.1 predicted protein [Monosiga brevicollis MX1]|eukprot:XP_001747805.1 hypothetical protein [Monosiga brevicollis MX1]
MLVALVTFGLVMYVQGLPLGEITTTVPASDSAESLPLLYLITATYQRETQFADLTRLCQTLLLVPRVHWIVIEDAAELSPHVGEFLAECGVPYSHLHAATPPLPNGEICKTVNRQIGCFEHRLGLKQDGEGNAVVYFADDDNTYSIELFKRMRNVHTIGVWRVGFLGRMRYSGPLSEMTPQGPKLTGWHVGWAPDRPYPLDMASFAFSVRLLEQRKVEFPIQAPLGQLETTFLEQLLGPDAKLEVLDTGVKRLLVWHTRTERPNLDKEGQLPDAPDTPVI